MLWKDKNENYLEISYLFGIYTKGIDMGLILIIAGLFTLGGFVFGFFLDRGMYSIVDGLRTGVGFGLAMFVVGAIIGVAGAVANPGAQAPVELHTDIVLMNDGTSTSGRFSIFSGYIETTEAYRYYYRQSDGGLKFASVPANDSTVYEDSESPYFISHCYKYVKSWYSLNPLDKIYCESYSFHVPKNSVAPGVNLDGE